MLIPSYYLSNYIDLQKQRRRRRRRNMMRTTRFNPIRPRPLLPPQRRCISTSSQGTSTPTNEARIASINQHMPTRNLPPLAAIPNAALLRSLAFTTIMSTSLLKPAMQFMKLIASHDAKFFSPNRNPIINMLLRPTFYSQFAAGENEKQVGKTIQTIKNQGFTGVILGYAREVVVNIYGRTPQPVDRPTDAELRDIELWKQGTLRTLRMLSAGDFLAIKYTGAGRIAVDACLMNMPLPPKPIEEAMDVICNEARKRGARIWIDAEQSHLQPTLDKWVLDVMKRHNRDGQALVYNTVQAYLKSSRQNIVNHLKEAQEGNWKLGIKLVRGAYIAHEPREITHDSKQETDRNYNEIVAALMQKEFPIAGDHGAFPDMQLFVASHNATTIKNAYSLHSQRVRESLPTIYVEYGQLMGMADDLSCELLRLRSDRLSSSDEKARQSAPKAFKCLSWGSTTELVQNLYRRAVENTDAIERTQNMAKSLRGEVLRRVGLK